MASGLWHVLPNILPLLGFLTLSVIQIRSFLRSIGPANIVFRRDAAAPINWRGAIWDLVKICLAAMVGVLATLLVQEKGTVSPSVPKPSQGAAISIRIDAGSAHQ
jgi:hypothetical protein